MERRRFIRTAAITGAAARLPLEAASGMPRRPFQKGDNLSIIGFGGIVVIRHEQSEADRIVARSFERGINYYDVAPSYGDGEAEITCKTLERSAAGATAELEQSLRRLKTDWFDLYQFHAVSSMTDVERILAPGGAAEAFVKAHQAGKVRYLGFSAHDSEAALALMERMPLDSVLFPVNFAAWSQADFGPNVLARAKEKGLARLALKAMAKGRWKRGADRGAWSRTWYEPVADKEFAPLALRWTLSQDITSAIPPGDVRLYEMALNFAAAFQPVSAAEREKLFASAPGVTPIFPVKG
jgi:aryl-alcohol dehydrogenase-like predicted oxidoreductase